MDSKDSQNKKAIIFDIGHVVIVFHLVELYRIFAEKAQIPFDFLDAFRKAKSKELTLGEMTKGAFFEEIQKHSENKSQTTADLETLWISEGLKLTEFNQELIDWIRAHRDKYTIGALSNLHPTRLLIDEQLNIKDHFNFVIFSCIEHLKKPDPAFYK